MDRVIMFRGKLDMDHPLNEKQKKPRWVNGYYTECNPTLGNHVCVIETEDEDYVVDFNSVGQYTGIKDKYNYPIFEGDILKANNGHIGWVKFVNGAFVKVCNCHSNSLPCEIFSDNCEIIGNIYDNPELVEVTHI